MPKVSVIIPVYKVEPYLRKCLDSVCNQTLSDIEIICVNDCSPDNSLAILHEYAKKDNRIKIIDFLQNKGAAAARNAGIDIAIGEYLGFVDSDDTIDLDFYEKLFLSAQENNFDIVVSNYDRIVHSQNEVKIYCYDDVEKLKESKFFLFSHCCAIYRRMMILDNNVRYPEKFSVNYDISFIAAALYYTDRIGSVNNVFYHYFCRDASATTQFRSVELTKEHINSIAYVFSFFENHHLIIQDYSVLVDKYFNYILDMFIQSPHRYHVLLRDDLINLYNIILKSGFIFSDLINNLFHSLKNENYIDFSFFSKEWKKNMYQTKLKAIKQAFLRNKK